MKQKRMLQTEIRALFAGLIGVVSVNRIPGEMVPGTIPTAPPGMQPTMAQLQHAVTTAAGTVISISAELPATYDAAGYGDTGIDWAAIGEVTDGGTHGRKYAEVTHKPIGSRGTQKFKGSFDEGTKTIQMGLDSDDAGQIIAKAAAVSDNTYSFKVVYPSGDKDYFAARVMSFEKQTSNVDSIVSATMQLSLTSTSAGVGIVEVLAV